MTSRMRGMMSLIATPSFAVMQSRWTTLPWLYTFRARLMGMVTASIALPLMLMPEVAFPFTPMTI